MKLKEFLSKQSAYVQLDMTLFIRLLEVAREEIKSDAELHYLAERCSGLAAERSEPLTMADYDQLWPLEKKS